MPIRTCVGCRAAVEADELVRVVAREGQAVVDASRCAAGRGAWLHPQASCLELALRRRAFPRALRTAVETASLHAAGPFL